LWARDAATVQLAAKNQLFVDLSDDLAGDVLEFLEMTMTRSKALQFASHCSSHEAITWVRAVNEAAVVVSLRVAPS
jgi:hypothetical protein